MTSAHHPVERWGDYRQRSPYAAFAALRERGPVHEVTLPDGHQAWVVLRHAEAKQALNDPRLSKDMLGALAEGSDIVDEGIPGPAYARHMLGVDPPDHTRLRHLVAERFTQRSLTALEPRIQQIVDRLLDAVAEQGPAAEVDLMEAFAFPMPFTVICEMLGIPDDRQGPLGASLGLVLRPIDTPEAEAAARRASEEMTATFAEVIALKEQQPGDDLISDLVAARRAAQLDQIELQSTLLNLIVAGHETTTNLIGNAVLALFREPELRATLTAHPDRIQGAIEELIRHDGPVHHATFRFAAEPLELGGVTIPAGAQVLVCVAAANRDEGQYTEPDRLDIGRQEGRHLGFGHGIHHCLGAALARMEGRLALRALLARFPEMAPAASTEDLRWDRGDGIVLRGVTALPVVPGTPA